MARDLESGGGGTKNNRTAEENYSAPESSHVYDSETHWTSWLVPMFVVANIAVFVITMYINNCPRNNLRFQGRCVARFLGRFSFQPMQENPLLGPSSSTYDLNHLFFFFLSIPLCYFIYCFRLWIYWFLFVSFGGILVLLLLVVSLWKGTSTLPGLNRMYFIMFFVLAFLENFAKFSELGVSLNMLCAKRWLSGTLEFV